MRHLIAALALATASVAAPASAQDAEGLWVASWTASPHAPLMTEGPFAAASYENVTISQVLRLSEGGSALRVRFTNRYGSGPLAIGRARVFQIDDAGAEVPGTSRMLTFGGETGAVIPRGSPFASDTVALDLPNLARIRVEFHLPRPTGPCTCHLTGQDVLAVSTPGDHVGEAWEPAATAGFRAFIQTVEVLSDDALGTVVTFGDSITDGVGSTPGTNRRWPDVLAERLQDAGLEYAVANAGISGNRVLSPGMGESALARLDEDVLALPNVTHMIVFVGVNDIGNRFGASAPRAGFPALDQPQFEVGEMIAGYRQLIVRAHEKGIRVIGSPIGPYMGAGYWSEEGEAARAAINDWILNSGEFDATVRLDTAFADPADPRKMRDGYHMGDFLHGSDAGLRAVGESIDLSLFAPPA
ncbi:SGNH/GDSL hydrolase family protein [Alteraurantiacibacter buctensis]|uniref:SGNH/GDSL hydrolase family protein n=1 Tax=Alteraurantiacibacter buctensis TaxID=1503981 RepID=A0A844YTH0_9SPHN|nr:SGNH/GDSL hydrolase family protein [Alteraurantiacibacter buctensis]MXO70849.1 SGNH/GDSL hydrolase family protein [Alteraurantiacibacter buctensis]